MKDILKEEHKQKDVDQEATLERIQSKNINVMRPLLKLGYLHKMLFRRRRRKFPQN